MKTYPNSARIARASGSNFYWSFFFLPRAKRNGILAIYAFSRLVDDAVDEAESEEKGRKEIALWRRRLVACYSNGGPSGRDDLFHPVLPEVADAIRKFAMPRQYLEDLLTGVEMDLVKKRYETFAELETYCYHVAGTVGLMCNRLFGYDDESARRYAVLLGRAFQLTNILRDVGKDAKVGRIYLPREDLKRFCVEEKDILEGRSSGSFRRLMNFEADRAEETFEQALALLPAKRRRKLLPAELMSSFYRRILHKVRQENYPVFEKTVSLPRAEKLGLLVKTLVRSWI